MIRVRFIEPTTEQWRQWRARAEDATAALVARAAAGDKITSVDIHDGLYKGARDYIYDAFSGKCAYCEAKFVLDQSGDIDHYRPKGRVTNEYDQPVRLNDIDHPGYYWLAYDWQNLLPCCSRCNRLSRTVSGRLLGKGTRFPVETTHVFDPAEDLSTESPMFLNPSREDPAASLLFDPHTGVMAGTNARGQMTVELLGLNREGLPEERQKIYVIALRLLKEAWDALIHENPAAASTLAQIIARYLDGAEAYSWPAQLAILKSRGSFLHLLNQVIGNRQPGANA